jgi:hypothetical protein
MLTPLVTERRRLSSRIPMSALIPPAPARAATRRKGDAVVSPVRNQPRGPLRHGTRRTPH